MPNETISRPKVVSISKGAAPLTQDLQASRCVPILALVLLVARRARLGQFLPEGVSVVLEGWAVLATELLTRFVAEPQEVQHARRIASRAIRIAQGYDSAARDKAYQCLASHLESAHGFGRGLTDEECVAINNGMLQAFAGYTSYLDHTAGAVAGGRS